MKFLQFLQNFLKRTTIKGSDLTGNRYHERLVDGKAKRWVEIKGVKDPADYDASQLPVQWLAWLRRTRNQPPTLEELEEDIRRIEQVKKNAEKFK